eukprot:g970.t1
MFESCRSAVLADKQLLQSLFWTEPKTSGGAAASGAGRAGADAQHAAQDREAWLLGKDAADDGGSLPYRHPLARKLQRLCPRWLLERYPNELVRDVILVQKPEVWPKLPAALRKSEALLYHALRLGAPPHAVLNLVSTNTITSPPGGTTTTCGSRTTGGRRMLLAIRDKLALLRAVRASAEVLFLDLKNTPSTGGSLPIVSASSQDAQVSGSSRSAPSNLNAVYTAYYARPSGERFGLDTDDKDTMLGMLKDDERFAQRTREMEVRNSWWNRVMVPHNMDTRPVVSTTSSSRDIDSDDLIPPPILDPDFLSAALRSGETVVLEKIQAHLVRLKRSFKDEMFAIIRLQQWRELVRKEREDLRRVATTLKGRITGTFGQK